MQLEICNVKKQYKDKCAVNGVNLLLTPGVWGLLGANGAGKTTLMRMIAGITGTTEGEIRYDGMEIHTMGKAYRDIFGYLPQEFGFYPGFSVQDYLEYMATLKGLPKGKADRKIKELLSRLTLEDVKRKKISKLSGGMKRRVGIAQALLNDPEVLILDEPTSGLDPGERVRFRNLLSEFARDRIVLISTHIVSDIEYFSTKNAVMKDGEILVANHTDPGWIMLFNQASAVVVECGSLLSHAAIVSREMGIPSVVSVSNVSERIHTGDRIRVDGSLGTVEILERGNRNEE